MKQITTILTKQFKYTTDPFLLQTILYFNKQLSNNVKKHPGFIQSDCFWKKNTTHFYCITKWKTENCFKEWTNSDTRKEIFKNSDTTQFLIDQSITILEKKNIEDIANKLL